MTCCKYLKNSPELLGNILDLHRRISASAYCPRILAIVKSDIKHCVVVHTATLITSRCVIAHLGEHLSGLVTIQCVACQRSSGTHPWGPFAGFERHRRDGLETTVVKVEYIVQSVNIGLCHARWWFVIVRKGWCYQGEYR